MKKRITIYIVILLLIVSGFVAFRWYMAMRPAFKYLALLESNDPDKIRETALILNGKRKLVPPVGIMHIALVPGHRPLHGIAAKAVKAKILEVLQTTENRDIRDSLLWATQLQYSPFTGIYYEGSDFDILEKVLKKQNVGVSGGKWIITQDDQGKNTGIFKTRLSH